MRLDADTLSARSIPSVSARQCNQVRLTSPREVQVASDGDHSDGGGLFLRVKGSNASWVYRYTAPDGRRREMGLGIAECAALMAAGEAIRRARRIRGGIQGGRLRREMDETAEEGAVSEGPIRGGEELGWGVDSSATFRRRSGFSSGSNERRGRRARTRPSASRTPAKGLLKDDRL